jgi:hypothetical protein
MVLTQEWGDSYKCAVMLQKPLVDLKGRPDLRSSGRRYQ